MAARKARGLLDCGARVTVVAPDVSEDMQRPGPRLEALERPDLPARRRRGFRLVITATGQSRGRRRGGRRGRRCRRVGEQRRRPGPLLVHPSAVHRDGAVTVAVSTGGLSPALAAWLRNRLAASCGSGLDALARLLHEARQRLRHEGRPSDTVDWAALLDGELPSLVRAGDADNAEAILRRATAD